MVRLRWERGPLKTRPSRDYIVNFMTSLYKKTGLYNSDDVDIYYVKVNINTQKDNINWVNSAFYDVNDRSMFTKLLMNTLNGI